MSFGFVENKKIGYTASLHKHIDGELKLELWDYIYRYYHPPPTEVGGEEAILKWVLHLSLRLSHFVSGAELKNYST